MREIALFVEDHAHQQVIEALLKRIAGDYGIATRLDWRSSVGATLESLQSLASSCVTWHARVVPGLI